MEKTTTFELEHNETDLVPISKVKKVACYCGTCGIKMDYEEKERLLKERKIIVINHICTICGDKLSVSL